METLFANFGAFEFNIGCNSSINNNDLITIHNSNIQEIPSLTEAQGGVANRFLALSTGLRQQYQQLRHEKEKFLEFKQTHIAHFHQLVKEKRADVHADIRRRTQQLEDERAVLDSLKTKLRTHVLQCEGVVRLNVGGTLFTTSTQTLSKYDCMLSALIRFEKPYVDQGFTKQQNKFSDFDFNILNEDNNNDDARKDQEDKDQNQKKNQKETIKVNSQDIPEYFIDRDGSLFGYILNYLRDGRLTVPKNFDQYEMLYYEADYYQVAELKAEIKARCPGLEV